MKKQKLSGKLVCLSNLTPGAQRQRKNADGAHGPLVRWGGPALSEVGRDRANGGPQRGTPVEGTGIIPAYKYVMLPPPSRNSDWKKAGWEPLGKSRIHTGEHIRGKAEKGTELRAFSIHGPKDTTSSGNSRAVEGHRECGLTCRCVPCAQVLKTPAGMLGSSGRAGKTGLQESSDSHIFFLRVRAAGPFPNRATCVG